ncbi:DUF86 domain-containing protein [Geomicrobium sp. JSM 1781026]|uniref:type VII toxin-antitoxin system HepT family RNase toxin n=1 Tax=Geomicrobium sp. JSM 1781026 TaxID=3344580 RepID=UPI0035C08B63
MSSDVVLNKVTTIERCMKRVKEVYEDNPKSLFDFTKQDSIILNIQRACEASIDLAMHIVSIHKLGLPQTSREAFDLLEKHEYIHAQTAKDMKSMIGFRNVAIHDYQKLNLDIMQSIIEHHMEDFIQYTKQIVKGL